ncbi:B3 domain-containing protein Os01g0234100-like isoform X2 [Rhodamnia argentea]|uniref:B3 domain-containing protein Os01g0234100-like isoform X2 n=1 Tax=Rhodamnia argentea TaxID=178133 RepID=A0ABM3HFZ7_9MYRT|nr:B3 domain-containing protein Os01g0234100-like isoform X2 [Rhodamnia argentea]
MAICQDEKPQPLPPPSKVQQGTSLKRKEKLLSRKPLGLQGASCKQVQQGTSLKRKEKRLCGKPSGLQGTSNKQVICCGLGELKSRKRERAVDDGYRTDSANDAMERAKRVRSTLSPEYPVMVKHMLPSHVTGGFWLGLPKQFCQLHLPQQDVTITLEDESGKGYGTKYLWGKMGLSGGWRGFSIAHNLLEGDALVFQLVKPTCFKVYIVRGSDFSDVDGALGLLSLDPRLKTGDSAENGFKTCEIPDDDYWKPLTKEDPPENSQNDNLRACDALALPVTDQVKSDPGDPVSEVLDGIRFSEKCIAFKDVRSVENFEIIANDLVIDSELSDHFRLKYYELCRSQKSYLHGRLLEGLNYKLAAGIISETVNVADAIRASRITTSMKEFDIRGKTLKAFQDMGMDVGFLRARLERLLELAMRSNRYREAESERAWVEEERCRLEAKLAEVREAVSRLNDEIESLRRGSDDLETAFEQVASAPW